MHEIPSRELCLVPWNIPVLLTSSVVAHDTRVTLTDTSERIDFAMESIARWLSLYPKVQLVLCDGSNFDFSTAVAQMFPDAKIECIFFENDQKAVRQNGRGFGEGEIIRFAIEHSQLIQQAGAFAKCTSKLWVHNYAECLTGWNGKFLCKAVFDHVFSPFDKIVLSYIDTRFYITSVAFYKQHFGSAHQAIDVSIGKGLEDCFLEVVNRDHLDGVLLNTPPVIYGVGGGIGKYYKNPLIRRLKEKLRLRIVRVTPEFAHFFSKLT
jgi:hypothetical protein